MAPNSEAVEDVTLLVVEDDDQVRQTISRILKSNGWRVLEAADGEEALRVAAEVAAPIDGIVADVRMPRMGGLELVHQFRRWYPTVRILLVSGDPEIMRESQPAYNGVAMLPKPFSSQDLITAVRALLE